MATSESMLAWPCCACFQAFTKNRFPKTNKTTEVKISMIQLAGFQSIKTISSNTTGTVSKTAPKVCF